MRRTLVFTLLTLALLFGVAPAHAQDDVHGWLFVPDIWLTAPIGTIPVVGDTYNMDAVGVGVGWLEGTAWVTDNQWRIALGAHNYGAFERLNELETGAWIYVADYPHTLLVEGYRVVLITQTTPDDVSWLQPTDGETLTLITCYGTNDELRLIVHAERAW